MRILISALLVSIFFSCNTQPEEKHESNEEFSAQDVAAMHDEVMVIHDEVMPKMEDLFNEKQRLTEILEGTDDSTENAALTSTILQLEEADEVMMQWMRDFSPREYANDTTALIEYYNNEKTRIEEVRSMILTTLESAQSF